MVSKQINSAFVGRELELAALCQLRNKSSASLVVVKGRRRVGKSRLIEEFAKDDLFYEFSGLTPDPAITAQQQRDHFAIQLSAMSGVAVTDSSDWYSLFNQLYLHVEGKSVIISFDEISWMGDKDPAFLGKLKNAWDVLFKKNSRLILILCGSVSAWIEKNILRSKLFMGRVSLPIMLKELSIKECNRLFAALGFRFSTAEKFKLLSVMGGIPRYLEEVQGDFSADENLRRLCFMPTGILVHEFSDIFTDIFSTRSATYQKIVALLLDGPATLSDLAEQLKLSVSGHLSACLEELCEAGIIDRYYTWSIVSGHSSSLSRYHLRDNYIRFYLKYIAKNLNKIEQNHFQTLSLSAMPGWSTIMGLQFENLVLRNREYVLNQLNIHRQNIVADNPYFQRKTKRYSGCQIDYLIQTSENTLYVCEIRFSKNEIRSTVIDEVKQKIERLVVPKGYAVLPVLIHMNHLQEAIEDSAYFYKIINFSNLLDS